MSFTTAPDIPMPQTWQVPRATYDDMLLRHAEASGADVRERHHVHSVSFEDDGVTLTVGTTDGTTEANRNAATRAAGTARRRPMRSGNGAPFPRDGMVSTPSGG